MAALTYSYLYHDSQESQETIARFIPHLIIRDGPVHPSLKVEPHGTNSPLKFRQHATPSRRLLRSVAPGHNVTTLGR